jgi:hypothetical protein
MELMDRRSLARAWRAAAALAATLTACAASAAEFRGFVSDGPAGLFVFQACAGTSLSARSVKVADKTPDTALTAAVHAVRGVMEDRARPLYVEFAGETNANVVTVQRFRRAIGHVLACAGAPKDNAAGTRLRVSSADGWRFTATATNAQLELEGGKVVRFPASSFAPSSPSAPRRVYDAWSAQDGGTIRVEVAEEVCLEERSETATGARVSLRYGSTSLEGCASHF